MTDMHCFTVFCSVGCHGDYCWSSLDYLCNSHLHRLPVSPQVSELDRVLDNVQFLKIKFITMFLLVNGDTHIYRL